MLTQSIKMMVNNEVIVNDPVTAKNEGHVIKLIPGVYEGIALVQYVNKSMDVTAIKLIPADKIVTDKIESNNKEIIDTFFDEFDEHIGEFTTNNLVVIVDENKYEENNSYDEDIEEYYINAIGDYNDGAFDGIIVNTSSKKFNIYAHKDGNKIDSILIKFYDNVDLNNYLDENRE